MSASIISQQFASLVNKRKRQEALLYLEQFTFSTFENVLLDFILEKKEGLGADKVRIAFIHFFFLEYLANSKYFQDICGSSRRRLFFEQLFMRDNLICTALYKRMAEEVPEYLVEALKRNRVPFLHQKHFDAICSLEHPHLSHFTQTSLALLVGEKNRYLLTIAFTKKCMGNAPLEGLLACMGLWMHHYTCELGDKFLKEAEGNLRVTNAVHAMSRLLHWFMHEKKALVAAADFNTDQFQMDAVTSDAAAPPFYEVFLAWMDWYEFVIKYVDPFCFDDSAKIRLSPGKLQEVRVRVYFDKEEEAKLFRAEQKLIAFLKLGPQHEWKKGGLGDLANEKEEHFLARFYPAFARDGDNLFDEFLAELFLDEKKLSINHVLAASFSITLVDKLIYLSELLKGMKKKQDWKEIIRAICENQSPFFKRDLPLTRSSSDFKSRIIRPELLKKAREMILGFESFTLDLTKILKHRYNRFNSEFTLADYLLFKIGKHCYHFPLLTARLQTHVFFSNLVLNVHKNREEQKEVNSQMERYMAQAGKKNRISSTSAFMYNYRINDRERIPGEIDAVLYDGDTLLGVEFKRSPFKATYEALSREKEVVLESAARQLDRFHEFLHKGDTSSLNRFVQVSEEIDLGKKSFAGIIVTTNFNQDHERIKGKYRKVSWREWIWLLNNIKRKEKLQDVLNKIDSDHYWKTEMRI